ncbi:6-bladed beta-propeller protein [bacterium JGI 053]|nr:6-bladed beta-propeller protein [bacterium JGI 053]
MDEGDFDGHNLMLVVPMHRFALALSIVLSFSSVPALSQRSGGGFPLTVVSSTIVGEDAEFGSIVAATVSPAGNVYVLDHVNCAVFAFSPAGRMLWKVGRKGRGPGEYQLPTRITATPTGALLVFDLGTGDVTTLSQDGHFVSQSHLPLRFPYVDDIAVVGSDLLISGYSPDPPARRHGIHRFRVAGGRMVYAGSFAPLPTVRDTAVLRYWGAGDITRAANGDLLFALALPYVVYRFDAAGRQKLVGRPRFRVRGTPDDAVLIERNGEITSISRSDAAVVDRPQSVVEVANGWMLVTRVTNRERHWDLFNPAGVFAGTREYPEAWGGAIAFDPARNFLWMAATRDDAPVLVRLQISSGAATPTRRAR